MIGKKVFITVTFGKSSFRTQYSSEHPNIWKQKCFIPIREYEVNYELHVSLYQSHSLVRNKCLGKASVPISNFLQTSRENVRMAIKLLFQPNQSCQAEERYYVLINGFFQQIQELKTSFWSFYLKDYQVSNAIEFLNAENVLEIFSACEKIHFPPTIFTEVIQTIHENEGEQFPLNDVIRVLVRYPIEVTEQHHEEGIFMDFCPKCSLTSKQGAFANENGILIHFAECLQTKRKFSHVS